MKKLLAILFLIIAVQGIAETVVKGTYETKRKRYVELTQTLEKEIFLNYTLPDNKKEIVTYKGKDFDILVSKNDLLELYNRRRVDKIDDIKSKISYKDEKFEYFRNYFSELIENNKAVVYDKKNEKEINYLIKVKYNNAIFYDNGGGSLYNGYNFYADKEWTELALQSDVITRFGVEIHSSIGNNPYNRELTPEAKKNFENNKGFNQRKELYEKGLGRVFVFLDVDGVLNINQTDDKFTYITSSTVWKIRNEVLAWIKEMSHFINVQFIWLSTWQNECNEINKKIGIANFPISNEYINPKEIDSLTIKKKQLNKLRSLYPLAKIISIDDDLEKTEVSSDFHLQPNSDLGLTHEDLEILTSKIKKYLEYRKVY